MMWRIARLPVIARALEHAALLARGKLFKIALDDIGKRESKLTGEPSYVPKHVAKLLLDRLNELCVGLLLSGLGIEHDRTGLERSGATEAEPLL